MIVLSPPAPPPGLVGVTAGASCASAGGATGDGETGELPPLSRAMFCSDAGNLASILPVSSDDDDGDLTLPDDEEAAAADDTERLTPPGGDPRGSG